MDSNDRLKEILINILKIVEEPAEVFCRECGKCKVVQATFQLFHDTLPKGKSLFSDGCRCKDRYGR